MTLASRVGWVARFWQPNITHEPRPLSQPFHYRVFVGLAYCQPNLQISHYS
jgi:hypothetical protein